MSLIIITKPIGDFSNNYTNTRYVFANDTYMCYDEGNMINYIMF